MRRVRAQSHQLRDTLATHMGPVLAKHIPFHRKVAIPAGAMTYRKSTQVGFAALVIALAGASSVGSEAEVARFEPVTDTRIQNALKDEPGSWMAHGQDFKEQRFSPLMQLNRETVADLGLVWHHDYKSYLGQQATPIVVNGLLIVPSAWNVVHVYDAKTGEERWQFDPGVDRVRQSRLWTSFSRGIAVYGDRLIIATMDGWLVSVDMSTGEEVWRTDTITDRSVPYFISGAPRIGGGKIYIGNAASEAGTRGYTSAYEAGTGKLAWRFWSIPGDPSEPFEHPELEAAARTWNGEWWKHGGGGNVWNSIVYDPDLKQVYLGTGNAAPWVREFRSPGGGDNLYVASIVAVDANSGAMQWYYQQTPGDNWDYTSTQDMALAELKVDGKHRKVILQAPKNGFFYVIDRTDGKLLRAEKYATVTWASHVDMQTGRPVEIDGGRYYEKGKWI